MKFNIAVMDKTKRAIIRSMQNLVLTHSIEILKPTDLMKKGEKIKKKIYKQREDIETLISLVGRQETKW